MSLMVALGRCGTRPPAFWRVAPMTAATVTSHHHHQQQQQQQQRCRHPPQRGYTRVYPQPGMTLELPHPFSRRVGRPTLPALTPADFLAHHNYHAEHSAQLAATVAAVDVGAISLRPSLPQALEKIALASVFSRRSPLARPRGASHPGNPPTPKPELLSVASDCAQYMFFLARCCKKPHIKRRLRRLAEMLLNRLHLANDDELCQKLNWSYTVVIEMVSHIPLVVPLPPLLIQRLAMSPERYARRPLYGLDWSSQEVQLGLDAQVCPQTGRPAIHHLDRVRQILDYLGADSPDLRLLETSLHRVRAAAAGAPPVSPTVPPTPEELTAAWRSRHLADPLERWKRTVHPRLLFIGFGTTINHTPNGLHNMLDASLRQRFRRQRQGMSQATALAASGMAPAKEDTPQHSDLEEPDSGSEAEWEDGSSFDPNAPPPAIPTLEELAAEPKLPPAALEAAATRHMSPLVALQLRAAQHAAEAEAAAAAEAAATQPPGLQPAADTSEDNTAAMPEFPVGLAPEQSGRSAVAPLRGHLIRRGSMPILRLSSRRTNQRACLQDTRSGRRAKAFLTPTHLHRLIQAILRGDTMRFGELNVAALIMALPFYAASLSGDGWMIRPAGEGADGETLVRRSDADPDADPHLFVTDRRRYSLKDHPRADPARPRLAEDPHYQAEDPLFLDYLTLLAADSSDDGRGFHAHGHDLGSVYLSCRYISPSLDPLAAELRQEQLTPRDAPSPEALARLEAHLDPRVLVRARYYRRRMAETLFTDSDYLRSLERMDNKRN
ncbi:hypothetical protein H696_00754 [Fonticula alba]|uniref:Uncharacterized protein n=1 Tax=Fonticula alba TaxID=691883 RepID=A0A058ZI59_FONAL|nr:hypothetical protein H696_00754 [Fonticula alba]KCV73212.1 hypothetical protein H696_00754 [Fonticula alba]|eukprot:XP_009492913.1 hypothetical protein H696_00754 [Fonticula alba]